MRLLLIAPPGAGKGTQAKVLSAHYGIDTISTGELLRREVTAGSDLGRAVAGYLARGDLVPDELMCDLVKPAVRAANERGGYMLDGYPRTQAQALQGRRWASEHGMAVDGAIYLEVSRPELLRRLLGRASEEDRSDDRQATMRHRLDVFETQTRPLLDFYRDLGILITIDGEQPVEAVTADILAALS
ncbi:MAG: adenylate kinase [Acidimicrobiales bacterium]